VRSPGGSTSAGEEDFPRRWNSLKRRDRLRIRRLVRLGRPVATRDEAALAVAYARWQASRPWVRWFWVWFVPALCLSLVAAARVHPVFVGVVLALAAQAVFAHRNLRRVGKLNAAMLEPGEPPKRA